jgi:hypothetical protein
MIGVRVQEGAENFSPSLLSNGLPGALSLEAKRSGREADHSPPSSAEIMEWSSVKKNKKKKVGIITTRSSANNSVLSAVRVIYFSST